MKIWFRNLMCRIFGHKLHRSYRFERPGFKGLWTFCVRCRKDNMRADSFCPKCGESL